MADVPNQFFNAAIKSQINLERYSEDIRLKVIERLNKAQSEIISAIAQMDSGGYLTPWKQERYRVLMDQIDGILKDAYSSIDGNVKTALGGLATYEHEKTIAEAKKIVGFNLFDVTLTEKNLESIVSKTMVDGHIIGTWWNKQAEDTKFKLEQSFNEAARQIQTGLIKGEAIGELVKRVRGTKDTPGVMNVSRREATALVRTSVMQVAHDTRLAMYEANADIIKGYQVVATLDNRTTPLCRALDGKVYDLDRKPIDHATPLPEGPPFHWNCRSTLIPVVKEYSELKKGKGGISKAKLDAIEALDIGTRTSFGVTKGYVDAGLDYNAWLKTQPEEYQIEVLGPARWNLWRDDKLTMADMIDQTGRPLTIKELNEKLAEISELKAKALASQKWIEELAAPGVASTFTVDMALPASVFPEVDQAAIEAAIAKAEKTKFSEPELKTIAGKKQSAGVIIFEDNGKVWIYEPSGHFGGYEHTFPKGTVEKGNSLRATAIREVWEETGLQAELVGHVGDYEKTTSVTRYYIGRRVSGNPSKMTWEAQAVKLVPADKAEEYLNVAVDKQIIADARAKFNAAKEAGSGDWVKGIAKVSGEAEAAEELAAFTKKYPYLEIQYKDEFPGYAELSSAQKLAALKTDFNNTATDFFAKIQKGTASDDALKALVGTKEYDDLPETFMKYQAVLKKMEELNDAAIHDMVFLKDDLEKGIVNAKTKALKTLMEYPEYDETPIYEVKKLVEKNAKILDNEAGDLLGTWSDDASSPELAAWKELSQEWIDSGKSLADIDNVELVDLIEKRVAAMSDDATSELVNLMASNDEAASWIEKNSALYQSAKEPKDMLAAMQKEMDQWKADEQKLIQFNKTLTATENDFIDDMMLANFTPKEIQGMSPGGKLDYIKETMATYKTSIKMLETAEAVPGSVEAAAVEALGADGFDQTVDIIVNIQNKVDELTIDAENFLNYNFPAKTKTYIKNAFKGDPLYEEMAALRQKGNEYKLAEYYKAAKKEADSFLDETNKLMGTAEGVKAYKNLSANPEYFNLSGKMKLGALKAEIQSIQAAAIKEDISLVKIKAYQANIEEADKVLSKKWGEQWPKFTTAQRSKLRKDWISSVQTASMQGSKISEWAEKYVSSVYKPGSKNYIDGVAMQIEKMAEDFATNGEAAMQEARDFFAKHPAVKTIFAATEKDAQDILVNELGQKYFLYHKNLITADEWETALGNKFKIAAKEAVAEELKNAPEGMTWTQSEIEMLEAKKAWTYKSQWATDQAEEFAKQAIKKAEESGSKLPEGTTITDLFFDQAESKADDFAAKVAEYEKAAKRSGIATAKGQAWTSGTWVNGWDEMPAPSKLGYLQKKENDLIEEAKKKVADLFEGSVADQEIIGELKTAGAYQWNDLDAYGQWKLYEENKLILKKANEKYLKLMDDLGDQGISIKQVKDDLGYTTAGWIQETTPKKVKILEKYLADMVKIETKVAEQAADMANVVSDTLKSPFDPDVQFSKIMNYMVSDVDGATYNDIMQSAHGFVEGGSLGNVNYTQKNLALIKAMKKHGIAQETIDEILGVKAAAPAVEKDWQALFHEAVEVAEKQADGNEIKVSAVYEAKKAGLIDTVSSAKFASLDPETKAKYLAQELKKYEVDHPIIAKIEKAAVEGLPPDEAELSDLMMKLQDLANKKEIYDDMIYQATLKAYNADDITGISPGKFALLPIEKKVKYFAEALADHGEESGIIDRALGVAKNVEENIVGAGSDDVSAFLLAMEDEGYPSESIISWVEDHASDYWANLEYDDQIKWLFKHVKEAGDEPLKQKMIDLAKKLAILPAEAAPEAEFVSKLVELGNKTYDLDNAADALAFKKNQSTFLSQYKKKILSGGKPSKAQKQAYDLLDQKSKELFDAKLEVAGLKQTTTLAQEVAPAATAIGDEAPDLKISDFTKYADKKGSNPGGFYQAKANPADRYYVKWYGNDDMVRNEMLADKLYQAAGVEVPDLQFIYDGDNLGIASRIVDGVKKDPDALVSGAIKAGAREDFVVDAWLADWDVVGTGYDNLVVKDGARAVRIDLGGSLRYRAQGGLKGKNDFGRIVNELDSMRDARINSYSAEVFKHVTQADLEAGARKVLSVSDDQIAELVMKYGPADSGAKEDLIDILIARKKDIAKRFPNALKGMEAAPAPAGQGFKLAPREYKKIAEARINGYAVRIDKRDLEDQQLLLWTQKSKTGSPQTIGNFKVRFEAQDRLDKFSKAETLSNSSASASPTRKGFDPGSKENEGDFNGSLFQALRGIGMQSRKAEPLRAKDIGRIQNFVKKYDAAMQELRAGEISGIYPEGSVQKMIDQFAPWKKVIDDAQAAGEGKIFKWANDTGWHPTFKEFEFIPEIVKTVKAVPPPSAEIKWVKKVGNFERNKLNNGWATQTDQFLGIRGSEKNIGFFLETEIDGARVRYWPNVNATQFANRGRVEILVPGEGTDKVDKILDVMKKLGIDNTRATDLDMEELYIRQVVYAMGPPKDPRWIAFSRGADAVKDQAERVKWMRAELNKIAGKNVTGSKTYNPKGSYEAFENGRFFTYRPDLEGPEWEDFKKNYRIIHHHMGEGTIDEVIDKILHGGATMAPSTDKIRRGIDLYGMSPKPDLESGGASFFFTRIQQKAEAYGSEGFVWKGDILARTDAWSYPSDFYGNMIEEYKTSKRAGSISQWRDYARHGGNETVFKNSLSFFDNMDRIVANSSSTRAKIIAVFKRHGYNDINGVPIENFVKLANTP